MKQSKQLFLLLAMIAAFNFVKAQNQKRLWSLPSSYIKFNTGSGSVTALPTVDYSGLTGTEAHNAMHDANGDLLFFITEEYDNILGTSPTGTALTVFDKDGRYIGVPSYNGLPVSNGSEIAIVPVPSECDKYYIIFCINGALSSVSDNGRSGYVTLDMSLQNAYGGYGVLSNSGVATLLKSTADVDPNNNDYSFFAVTPLRPISDDRILFLKQRGRIYKFLITQTNIAEFGSGSPDATVLVTNNSNQNNELEVIALVNGNYRLAMVSWQTTFYVADFNSSGTYVSSSFKVGTFGTNPGYNISGIEFDPSGTYLYIAKNESPYLGYVNVTTTTIGTPTTLSLSNASLFGNGQTELGCDNKMYFANTGRLGALPLNSGGTPNTGSWSDNAVPSLSMGSAYLNDQIDGEVYFPVKTYSSSNTIVYLNNVTENSSATYTPTSNNGTSPPTGTTFIYVVNGTYTINANAVTFDSCQTYFAPDAQVIVNANAYLRLRKGSVWQANCDHMWNGIILNTGSPNKGSLLVDNSTIQDAKLAIDSKVGSPFLIQNGAKLNINYRNIFMEPFAGTHPGKIKGSTISCLDGGGSPANILLPPYSTVQGYSGRTYRGIEIDTVTQANIGVDSSGLGNTFNYMDRGIDIESSSTTIYNNTFTNIDYTASGGGFCIHSQNYTSTERTLTVGNTGTYQPNTFTNSTWGVKATTHQDVNITKNTFSNLNTGMYINDIGTTGNAIMVQQNIIDDCDYGIIGFDNLNGTGSGRTFNVLTNTINNTGTAKPNSYGIWIANASRDSIVQLNVNSNIIKRVSTGIEVTNFTAPQIRSNKITSLSDLGSSTEIHGIYVTTSPRLDVEFNYISGAGGSKWYQKAIIIATCTNFLAARDTVSDIGSGFLFAGVNTTSETGKNLMNNNYDGMEFNYGEIGYQYGSPGSCISPGNAWQGTFGRSHICALYSNGNNSEMNLYGSTCNPASGACMNPSPFVSLNPTGFGYSAVPIATGCTTLSGRSADEGKREQMLKVARNEMSFPAFEESTKWWSRYELYNTLQSDPSLQYDVPELKSFVDSISQYGIGKLYQINQAANNRDDLPAAASLANSFTTGNAIEQYLKTVYGITINQRTNNTLSSIEIEQLQQIAKLCPFESGPAVYNARVLLFTVDKKVYRNDCEVVSPTKGEEGRGLAEENPTVLGGVAVFPNPAKDKLNVVIHLEQGQEGVLTVYDLAGKIVLSYTLNGNNDAKEVSTASLSPGMYFYKININNSPVSSGKLSIIR